MVGALAETVRVEASSVEELEAKLRDALGGDVPSGSSVRITVSVRVEVRAFLLPRTVLKEVDEIVGRVREEASQYLDNIQVLASYNKVEDRWEWGWWVGVFDVGIVVSGVAKSPIALIISVVGLVIALVLVYFTVKEFRAIVELIVEAPKKLAEAVKEAPEVGEVVKEVTETARGASLGLGLGAGALLVLLILLLVRELRR